MASFAIHPPVHLIEHPDEPIRTVEAALTFVRRHVETDEASRDVLAALQRAADPDAAERAGQSFRAWAKKEGHLLTPPDSSPDWQEA